MAFEWVEEELRSLQRAGLLRERRAPFARLGPEVVLADGRRLLNLCSNDYLSLSSRLVSAGSVGSGASRLVVGDEERHRALEQALSAWLGTGDALLFSSGYAANVGAVSALSAPGTLVVSDERNHASIIDGCRLGRGRVEVVPHGDVPAVERALRAAPERRRIVVTEGYFSMEGTRPALRELRAVCDEHEAALYVDEAHALGVWGEEGRGACAAAGVRPDLVVGTLGKAFGAGGAFVASSAGVTRWLWNRARSQVFSTALSPALAASALEALALVRAGEARARLFRNVGAFRAALEAAGIQALAGSEGPIVPVVLGAADRAVRAAERLLGAGVFVHPMRPPTVARETSRLRLTVQAGHEPQALEAAAAAVAEAVRE